ncbi:hypothetical protein [Streptococcus hyointestinalis]|nr:hypothetical protein [Streptococcus hyointestinalis]
MAQRQLKLKVSADIDKSLQKLLKTLESTQTLKVKTQLDDGGLSKMLKSLNAISSKKVKVGLDVDGRSLNALSNRVAKLADKKLKVSAEADDSSVKKVQQSVANLDNAVKSISRKDVTIDIDASKVPYMAQKLEMLGYAINDISKKTVKPSVDDSEITKASNKTKELEDDIDGVNRRVVAPKVDISGLQQLGDKLDEISSKILNIAGKAIKPAVELAEDSLDLYDTQKSFQLQMQGLGLADESINNIIKDMNDYGKQSKYSVADMLKAYSEFKGAGMEDPTALIKGMAGLASYGAKPSQALQALITNMTEGSDTDSVYNGDWRQMRKAIGASASKSIRDWFLNNKGLELNKENLSEGMITIGDFKQAISAIGNQDTFQKMAQQTNTLSSALENLKESFTVGMIGDLKDSGPMAKFTEGLIKIINDFSDAVPLVSDRLSGTLDKLLNVFGRSFDKFNAKDFLNGVFDSLDRFVDFVTPFINAVGKLTDGGKNLGTFAGNLVKYAAEFKVAAKLFKGGWSLAKGIGNVTKFSKQLAGFKFPSKTHQIPENPVGGVPAPPADGTQNVSKWSKLNSSIQQGAFTIGAVGVSMAVLAKSMEIVASVNIPTDKLAANVAKIGIATGLIAALYGAMDKLSGKFEASILNGVKSAIAVGASAVLLAEALKHVAEVDIPAERLLKNTAKIAIAVGGLSAVYGVMGHFSGGFAGKIMQGVVAALAVGASMVALAHALKYIADIDIPSDRLIKNVTKIAATIGIVGLGLAGLGAALTAGFGTGAIVLAAGIAGALAIGATLALLAKAFESMAKSASKTTSHLLKASDNIKKLATVEFPSLDTLSNKLGQLKQSMETIYDAIGNIGGSGFWSSLIESWESGFDIKTMDNAIKIFTDVNDFIHKIMEQPDPDGAAVIQKVYLLKNTLTTISSAFSEIGGEGFWSSLIESWESNFDVGTANNAIEMFTNVAKFIQELSTIPVPESDAVTGKIGRLKDVIERIKKDSDEVFANNFFTAWLDSMKNGSNLSSLKSIIEQFTKVITFTQDINKLPDAVDIEGKLNQLKKILKQMAKFEFPNMSNNGAFDGDNFAKVKNMVTKLSEIAKTMQELKNLPSPEEFAGKVEALKRGIEEMSKIDLSSFNIDKSLEEKATQVKNYIGKLKSIATSLGTISETNIADNIPQIIENLKQGLNKAKEIDLSGFKDNMLTNSKNAIDFIGAIATIGKSLGELAQVAELLADTGKIESALDNLKNLLGDEDGKLSALSKAIKNNFQDVPDAAPVVAFIGSIKQIADAILQLDAIASQFEDMTAFNNAMEQLVWMFDGTHGVHLVNFKKAIEANFKEPIDTSHVLPFLDSIRDIANKLTEITAPLQALDIDAINSQLNKLIGENGSGIFDKLTKINQAMMTLGGSGTQQSATSNNLGLGYISAAQSSMSATSVSSMSEQITSLVTEIVKVANKLVELQSVAIDTEAVNQKINDINLAMMKIKTISILYEGLSGKDKDFENINKVVTGVVTIANNLNAIPPITEGVVTNIGQVQTALSELNKIATDFSVSGITNAVTAVQNMVTALMGLEVSFVATGKSYGSKLIEGFTGSNWQAMVDKVTSVITTIEGKADLTSIGQRMSTTLVNGFDVDSILFKIEQIQTKINSLTGKTVKIDIQEVTTKTTVKKASGGIIPEYRSTGGRVGSRLFKSRGTDTVPAMLTAGEYVIKRSVTSALGKGFLDNLNQLNLRGALMALANKTGNQVINNTTNNITQNVDNKASFINGLGAIGRVVRA